MPVMANFLLVHEAIGWWTDCVNCRPFPLIYDLCIFLFWYLYLFHIFLLTIILRLPYWQIQSFTEHVILLFANDEAIGWLAKCVKCKPFALIYDVCIFCQGSYLPINLNQDIWFSVVQNSTTFQNLQVIWVSKWGENILLDSGATVFNSGSQNKPRCRRSSNLQELKRSSIVEVEMYFQKKSFCSFKAEAERHCSVSLSGKPPKLPQTGTIGNMGPSRGQRGWCFTENQSPLFLQQKQQQQQQQQ